MKLPFIIIALVALSSCGQAKESKGGSSNEAIKSNCADQTAAMLKNHIPLPGGASPDAVTQACIRGAQRYRDEVTKPTNHTVTPATNN